MRPGAVIYRKNHPTLGEVLVRYPRANDLRAVWRYANALSKERTFVGFQGEKVTLAAEKKWLDGQLQGIKAKNRVQLLMFCGGKLCGISDVHALTMGSARHTAVFGISIAKGFRGQGLGKLLMQLILKEAKRHVRGLKIITLGVFGDNKVARDLYKKLGFKRYGLLPGGARHGDKYVPHEQMYKKIK